MVDVVGGCVGRNAREEQVDVDLDGMRADVFVEGLELGALDRVPAERGDRGSCRDLGARKDASTLGTRGASFGQRREPRLIQNRRQ